MFGSFKTKEVEKEKWLGDIFHHDGLRRSVEETVKERTGRAKAAIFETRAIMQDYRFSSISGLLGALDIWEGAIVQALLYNSETWTEISDATIESLDSLQNMFLRLVVFDTPASSPRTGAVWCGTRRRRG